MKISHISKLIQIVLTISSSILFPIFGFLFLIFIFEIPLSMNKFLNINMNINIPTISNNEYFNINKYEFFNKIIEGNKNINTNKIKENILKAIINLFLLNLFWLQHIILSNKNFKNFMEKFFNFNYHLFERGFFNLSKI